MQPECDDAPKEGGQQDADQAAAAGETVTGGASSAPPANHPGAVHIPQRLVTSIRMDTEAGPESNTERTMSVRALHQLELQGGHRITLLDDRGWSATLMGLTDLWAATSLENLTEQARAVVGPDEPPPEGSQEQEARWHWSALSLVAEGAGVAVSAEALAGLRHDVEIDPALRERIALARRAAGTQRPS